MESGICGVYSRGILVLVELSSNVRCEDYDRVPEGYVLFGVLVLKTACIEDL